MLGLPRRRLGQLVRERYGESLTLTQTAEATGLLESLYRDNGFMNPRIDAVTSIDEESGRAIRTQPTPDRQAVIRHSYM